MKVISLCFWKRPLYAEQVLNSLKSCTGIGDYYLVIHLDGPPLDEMLCLCKAIKIAPFEIIQASRNLSCNVSTRRALARAFELSDYVIHVEEDVILAPDALLYFEWAKQFGGDASLFSVGAWLWPGGWLPESGKPFPVGEKIQTKASKAGGFYVWGWATWKDRWLQMNDNWTTGNDKELSWDVKLTEYRHQTGRFSLVPWISRAQNIGAEGGVHRGDSILSYWAGSTGFQRDTQFQLV